MAVELTNSAKADVVRIYMVGFHQFGEARSDKYQIGLQDAFERLGRYPQAARAAPELGATSGSALTSHTSSSIAPKATTF